MKRFNILTLIDVTQSHARRNDGEFLFGQQSNYNTIIQTIGLRVNPIIENTKVSEQLITNLGFGSNYKGKNKVWEIEFSVEYTGAVDTDILKSDFNLIPIVAGLNETIKLNPSVFRTNNSKLNNIIFYDLDK